MTFDQTRDWTETKIKRKWKRKRKQKRNGWSNLQGAQVPPLAFSFEITLNLNFPPPPQPPVPVPRREKKNHEKNEVWLKWKFRSWRSILSKNRQNRSYPRGVNARSKFRLNRPRNRSNMSRYEFDPTSGSSSLSLHSLEQTNLFTNRCTCLNVYQQ